jgi:hypothetical protein
MLDSAFIDRCTFHTNQEMVLVINEKDEYILAQTVIYRRHVVLRMREKSGLEDGSQI